MSECSGQKITVHLDAELRELVPDYLEHRKQDVEKMKEALSCGDIDTLRTIGHKMKGSGGGYGFNFLTQIGKGIEDAAKASDMKPVSGYLEQLIDFFERLEIVYE